MSSRVKPYLAFASHVKIAACVMLSTSAMAETPSALVGGPSPVISTTDGNGVNLFTGQFDPNEPAVSVGPQSNIEFKRKWTADGWRHSFQIYLIGDLSESWIVNLDYGTGSDQFSYDYGTGKYRSRSGNTLVQEANGDFTFTEKSGLKIILSGNGVGTQESINLMGAGVKIIKPNGEILQLKYDLAYDTTTTPNHVPYGIGRLGSVISNLGYRIDFSYITDAYNNSSGDYLRFWNWKNITGVTAYNLTEVDCPYTTYRCPAGPSAHLLFSRSISGTNLTNNVVPKYYTENVQIPGGYTATYSYEGQNSNAQYGIYITAVTVAGSPNVSRSLTYAFTLPPQNGQGNPGSAAPMGRSTVRTFTTSAGTYNYAYYYDTAPGGAGEYGYDFDLDSQTAGPSPVKTIVTDPAGAATTYYGDSDGKLYRRVDPLGRTTNYSYKLASTSESRMYPIVLRTTAPEQNQIVLTPDERFNIVRADNISKTGPGGGVITASAVYPAACTNPLTCNAPSSVTDPRGNITDYIYSSDHGGVLTETAPAAPDGIRKQVRNAYVQRQAWVASGSGYAPTGQPVWLLARSAFCRTSATINDSCAGGTADEQVTTYDYGPDSGPNNLRLRGKVEDATGLAARTCYGYDWRGNRISETAPRAALASCP